jgi:excisionase family DNA binding protein
MEAKKPEIVVAETTPSVMTVIQTAQYLNLSPQYIYLLGCQKKIPVHKLGRAIRITKADADAWLAEHRVPALA